MRHQQTIKLAINCETGELISAESLLELDEATFAELRRSTIVARVERKRGGAAVVFRCAICKQPVFLARYKKEFTNRWFVHDGKSEACPWHEGNRLTPDQTKALIYRGQQEGAKHQEIKRFLACWLEATPLVSGVSQEQTTFSEVVKGEWRRPDVKCQYQEKRVVFEIQLSYTFLSDVIARDAFYKRDRIFIIWLFAAFDLNRAVVVDEAFFNRRNLFVLDKAAVEETKRRGVLTFSGYRQVPQLIDGEIRDDWRAEFVALDDIRFPNDTFRPYFFDYEAERKQIEVKQKEGLQNRQKELWSQDVQEYIDVAIRYYESDYADELKLALLDKADKLKRNHLSQQGLDALSDYGFCGWHAVLPVLLSIKLNKPIGYSRKLTVFQIIEAGLRHSQRDTGKHAFAILYLWAYKEYSPFMSENNREWVRNKAMEIKKSIDSRDAAYQRFTGFDRAICLLFPEMEKYLSTSFGKFSNNSSREV